MSRHPDVALIVDQKWRDLPGLAAVAAWLDAKHGLSTKLLPYSKWREVLILERPRAIAVTHMNGTRSRAIADTAISLRAKVIVMQTEGRPNNNDGLEYSAGSGTDARGVDLWFTWGSAVRDFMVQRGTLPPERIVTAGVHRFDFYRSPMRQLVESREAMAERHGLDPSKPIITLATNFTCAKFYARNRQFLSDDWKDLGLSKYAAYSDPEGFAIRDWTARERTLEVIEAVLAARPNVQLVIKPHPTEEHERYRAFADQQRQRGSRVAFVGLDYIYNVLAMSDLHVHRLCTTGVEAWLAGVPSVDLHVADYDGWSLQLGGAAAEAVAGHDLVETAEGLIDTVDHYLSGGVVADTMLQARDRYIRKWLHTVDGCRAEAHADAIAQLLGTRDERRRPAIPDVAKALARRLAHRAFGDEWGARREAPAGAQATAVDQLGQVDARMGDRDAAAWCERTRDVVRQSVRV